MSHQLWILTGAPGSGKTAILDELRLSLRCVDEPASRVLEHQRGSGYRHVTVPRGPATARAAFVSERTLGRTAGSRKAFEAIGYME